VSPSPTDNKRDWSAYESTASLRCASFRCDDSDDRQFYCCCDSHWSPILHHEDELVHSKGEQADAATAIFDYGISLISLLIMLSKAYNFNGILRHSKIIRAVSNQLELAKDMPLKKSILDYCHFNLKAEAFTFVGFYYTPTNGGRTMRQANCYSYGGCSSKEELLITRSIISQHSILGDLSNAIGASRYRGSVSFLLWLIGVTSFLKNYTHYKGNPKRNVAYSFRRKF